MVTWQSGVSAWRTTLVRASWTIRKAARSISGGRGRRSPSRRTSTWTPASFAEAVSRSRSASPGAGSRGAVSAPGPGSVRRNAPRVRRSPARVSLLVSSMMASALRASSGCVSMTRRPTPAWMAMTPMLCAIMSCSSRAIRSRSAATAWAAVCERSAAACSRRSRTEWPVIQAAARARTRTATVRAKPSVPVPRRAAKATCTPSVVTAAVTAMRRGRVATTYPAARSFARTSRYTTCQNGVVVAVTYVPRSISVRAGSGRRRSSPRGRTVTAAADTKGKPGESKGVPRAAKNSANG